MSKHSKRNGVPLGSQKTPAFTKMFDSDFSIRMRRRLRNPDKLTGSLRFALLVPSTIMSRFFQSDSHPTLTQIKSSFVPTSRQPPSPEDTEIYDCPSPSYKMVTFVYTYEPSNVLTLCYPLDLVQCEHCVKSCCIILFGE